MTLSTVRLYHPALWKILFSYRVVLVTLRSVENITRLSTYVFFRGPLLLAWTRLPVTRGRQPLIWKSLAEVIAPIARRPSLSVGESQLGSSFALAGSSEDMASIQDFIVGGAHPPGKMVSLLGSFMRGMFTAMGPAFIKFGQILSMREEFPHAMRVELSLLQDKLPPMPYKTVRKILERELDRPVEEVFEWVEENPVAAASLAQVHRAKLRKEQAEVALKIQRPYLPGTVVLDTIYLCDIVIALIQIVLPTLAKGADFGCFTTSYRESLTKEIDFVLEERNQAKFRKLIMSHPIYSQASKVAETYREYTTTKLLTMEYIRGYYRLDRLLDDLTPQQLWDFASTKLKGLPEHLSLQPIWIQIAIQLEGLSHWGLSHGDVHLGNLYALAPEKEGDPWRMFLCDFGMMIEQSEPERIMTLESGASLAYYWDGTIIGRAMVKQSTRPVPTKNRDKVINNMATAVDKYIVDVADGKEKMWFVTIQRGTKNTMLSELVYGVAPLGLKMSPFNWLFLKNFSYVANVSTSLWASYSPTQMWTPHIKKYIKDIVTHDLENKNITNMRTSLPDILFLLREYDRKEILRALSEGNGVTPLPGLWAHDWDVREELTLREPQHM
jgi:hypothetical protein